MSVVFNAMHGTVLKITNGTNGDFCIRCHTPVGMNLGEAAGQTVPHLHLHLIPRYSGDVEDPRGGVRWVLPEKAAYWRGGGS